MKYRSRPEIMAAILKVVLRERAATKTKIMYGAFLSFSQLDEYMKLVLERGLLSSRQNVYILTEVGMNFLKAYREIEELVEVHGHHNTEFLLA